MNSISECMSAGHAHDVYFVVRLDCCKLASYIGTADRMTKLEGGLITKCHAKWRVDSSLQVVLTHCEMSQSECMVSAVGIQPYLSTL